MLVINFAHIEVPLITGQWVTVNVFDATATDGEQAKLLANLVEAAELQTGLQSELSALGYVKDGEPEFFGEENLVKYLQKHGVPEWTHRIEV